MAKDVYYRIKSRQKEKIRSDTGHPRHSEYMWVLSSVSFEITLELRMRKRKKTELKKRKIIKNKIRLANKKLTASNLEKKIRKDSSTTSLNRFITDFVFAKPKSWWRPFFSLHRRLFKVDFRSFKFGSISALNPSWSSFTGLRFFSRSKSGSSVSRKR